MESCEDFITSYEALSLENSIIHSIYIWPYCVPKTVLGIDRMAWMLPYGSLQSSVGVKEMVY